jgi:pimeloyl-ACP methyl ester carboxylesterase
MNASTSAPPPASRIRWADLAGREHGPKSQPGPPFVFLHGLTFDRRMWDPVIGAFPHARAIAFDLPGHGGSPEIEQSGLEPVVDAIHAAVLDAEIDRPVVVGHSIGGPLATLYAATYPAAAVVSVEAPIRLEPFAELLRSMRAQLEGEGFADIWSMLLAGMQMELVPAGRRELLRSDRGASQQLFLRYQADLLDRPIDEVVRRRDDGLNTLRLAQTPYVSVHSNPVDPAERSWLAERLPQAEIVVWPVRHHFPHLADPVGFAALLAEVALEAAALDAATPATKA